jgi:TRAP-type C4-dicarboxylate transport system substrate-binding protein
MHRRPSLTRALTVLAALAVMVAAGAGCGSGVDKAGGTHTPQPVVLTLVHHEFDPDPIQYWIDEVQRRSGGSLRIQMTSRYPPQEYAYDKATIADVQAGKVQLANVSTRVFDTVGVTSFQALLAPFLIDNHPLERRVLESDLVGEMLAGTSKLGLVGLEVIPTQLRKPIGVSRPLVTLKDYQGARIGVREGEVAKATFKALGATPVPSTPKKPQDGLDGGDGSIATNVDQGTKAVTSNVTLWPRPMTLVINRKTFESLTPSQQEALQTAGSAVLSRQFDFAQALRAEDEGKECRRGFPFVQASNQDLAALRRAVQPVYDQLERDAETKSLLQRILAMKHEARAAATPDNPRCSPSSAAAGGVAQKVTALDGVYRTSFTREELAKSPLLADAGEINDQNWGDFTLTFDHGRVTFTQRNDLDHYSTSGTYTLDGKLITLKFTEGGNAGETFSGIWSLYRDVLTFKRGALTTPYVLKPWRRVD